VGCGVQHLIRVGCDSERARWCASGECATLARVGRQRIAWATPAWGRLAGSCMAVLAVALSGLWLIEAPSASAQVSPVAPENLRCPGQPPPPSPGPGWQVQPVWEWREIARVEGTVGSNDGPYAVAVDRQCNIYLTDAEHFRLTKLSKDGTIVAQWPMPGTRAPGESSSPRGVAVDGQGNVYVTDAPRDRVYKFSPQGQVSQTWGACPDGGNSCDPKLPGRFIGPEGIAVDGAGNVYVAEGAGNRVQKLSADGKSLAVWDLAGRGLGELFIPGSLAIDQSGFVYMTEGFNNWVIKFNPDSGAIVSRWGGTAGGDPGQFKGPSGVGVDAAGNLYVSDIGNWRVQKLDSTGGFVEQWRNCLDGDPPCQFPDAGTEPGQFFASRGIALDGQGTVYVADTANKRLQRLMIVDWMLIPPPEEGEGG
jgi:DNA-binding beta-propeller fold protein YncE